MFYFELIPLKNILTSNLMLKRTDNEISKELTPDENKTETKRL